MPVPIHVIGGFLGAGKTSALVSLLEGPLAGERVAVVVNDFGQGAIDDATVRERPVTVREILGACVCCTAPEGFVGAVAALLDDAPDRILVEPTGLARPADLVDTLRRAPFRDRIALGPLIVMVDPAVLAAEGAGEVADQAQAADVLVANRTDLASDDAIAAFDQWAAALWPGPLRVIRTSHGKLGAEVLAWPDASGPRTPAAHHHGHHHHDHGDHEHHDAHASAFSAHTWSWPPDTVFHRRRLLDAIAGVTAAGPLARAKGMFRTDEGWARVELAGGRVHEATTSWRRDSRVDVLGPVDRLDADRIATAFAGAVLTETERAVAAAGVEIGLPDGSVVRFDRGALAALPGGVADVAPLLPGRAGTAASVGALLDRVGAPAGAQAVVVAADGYTTPAVPADALRAGLLIHSLDGGALPASHGGPLRLMIPGDAGPGGPCANVKAVVRIAIRAADGG